jgi:hypothetical protein
MRRVLSATVGLLLVSAAVGASGAGATLAISAGGGRAVHPALLFHARGAAVSRARARALLAPPPGQVFTGVSSGPVDQFDGEVGKHPAVYGEFVTWGQSIHFAFNDAASAHARLMLHIGTGPVGHSVITPAQIAAGSGDSYLLTLSQLIATSARPVYIRLLPEMNNANNPYCAVNADGSSRGAAYSPAAFIAAWRRVVTVLRGGAVSAIDAKLAALGQPALRGVGAGGSLAQSPIAFVWTPETAGTPNIATNSAATYYPGNAYVDWVGTDFYSKFPNFTGLDTFYHAYPGKPFAFGEWAIWGGDDPSFVNQLFAWVNSHKRVQMMVYNQGYITNGPFRLNLDPLSAAAIRTQLVPARFLATTPGS